ncbi:hypothetical protein LPLWJ_24160 [Lactiplantibacillus plantarum WJL]|nr:hypothetical protein LPLWJ_24160 [Lactiplantibacillus plantarum WJL]
MRLFGMCATQHGAGHRYVKNSVPMMRSRLVILKCNSIFK